MSSSVFVAGLGIISAIGNNIAECLSALEHEQAGILRLKNCYLNQQWLCSVSQKT